MRKSIIRNRVTAGLAALTAVVVMSGCGSTKETATTQVGTETAETAQQSSEGEQTQVANPWRDCTEQEARENCAGLFKLPEEDLVCGWSIMEGAADPGKNVGPMIQADFRYAGYDYTARAQQGVAETEDISGAYYDWDYEDDAVLTNWGDLPAKVKSHKGSDEDVALITWYDASIKTSYCLEVAGEDLDGYDIQAIAEMMNAAADGFSKGVFDPADVYVEPEHELATDLTGCDTFTQIVDRLQDGRGYTNTTLGETDVLLIADEMYEWEPGETASIGAEIFEYKDGAPYYLGYVGCGGTAYPLQIKDGFLYAGGNHYMRKYTVKNDALIIAEEVYVDYDSDGKDTYYYRTADTAFADHSADEAAAKFDALFAEMEGDEVLIFDRVGGTETAELPDYEYPGPEAFYTVLYKYLIDTYSPDYPEAQVCIPCPVIVAEDESDKDDIRVYGDFWIFNYDLNGDVLENTSGGAYPGCIHLKSVDTAEGYEVTSMEVVEDGSGYTESAKKIFGKHYDDFAKINSDDKSREETRAQIIANYVAANDLKITAFQDYGWDPVPLPEENIDSFYSILD